MTKQNPYLIKENYKQVEEVREIENKELITPKQQANLTVKNEYPSYEKFMKTYEGEEDVIDSYEFEVDSYGDIRTKGTYYGPGFWDDFVKPVASATLFAASVFPPTAPVAMTISLTVAGTSAAAAGLGHVTDIKELKDISKGLAEIALTGIEAQK
jgi:hypothetical protein